MKRYESMSKREIVAFAGKCHSTPCNQCQVVNCKGVLQAYLEQEIQHAPRYATIKNEEDLDRVGKDFDRFCVSTGCVHCRFRGIPRGTFNCFVEYLKEQVEVEERED